MAQKTKADLARALKELVDEKPLAQITVTEVASRAGINRQTFYYHFKDIYDLIGWIYQTEALEAVEGYVMLDAWQQGMLRFLEYIRENRSFCLRTYQAVDTRQFEDFVFRFAKRLLGQVMAEVAQQQPLAPKEDQEVLVCFYSCGFVGMVRQWLEAGAEEAPEELVERLSVILEGHFAQGLERLFARRSKDVFY